MLVKWLITSSFLIVVESDLSNVESTCKKSKIEWIRQPSDILEVNEHDSMFIPCEYHFQGESQSSQVTPFWIIEQNENQEFFDIGNLPPRHIYNGTGVEIVDVPKELNKTTYRCGFDVIFTTDVCESKKGMLLVNASSALLSLPLVVPSDVAQPLKGNDSVASICSGSVNTLILFCLLCYCYLTD